MIHDTDYDRGDWEHEVKRDKALDRIAELEAENERLKETRAIPPGYRFQPISEFDAMESARIESETLRARVAELEGHLTAICEMQQRHYGRGFYTHIELIDLAAAARAALEKPQ